MDHLYEKPRLSSELEDSTDLGSSEELGFISNTPNPKETPWTFVTGSSLRVWRSFSTRTICELCMGAVILILLLTLGVSRSYSASSAAVTAIQKNVARFGPALPEKEVTFGNIAGFGPDLVYVDHEMLWNATHKRELHENWQALYPKGRGYIKSTPEKGDDFDYANPPYHIDDFFEPGDHHEGYILSVFHQMHCLSILTSRLGTSYEEFSTYTRPQLEHTTHCIEYLRQAILCAGDTALEGETGAWPASAAWGQKHTCKDYDALIAMADGREMWDLSGVRHPDIHKIHPDPKETEGKYGGD